MKLALPRLIVIGLLVQLNGTRPRTEACYLNWVRQLQGHELCITDLTSRQILDYLIFLQKELQLSGSTVNQAVSALRCFYRDHLERK